MRRHTGPMLGAHQSIEGGLHKAIKRGQQATCDTIQIFNKSSMQWRAHRLLKAETNRFFGLIEETGVTVACSHTSYLINLASPQRGLNRRSYLSLRGEVKRCNLLQIPNLVLHPGAHVGSGSEAGMDRIAQNLNRLFDEVPDNTVTLCLESTSGAGSVLGGSFEELAYIIDRVDNGDRMGVCLDTCHLFAAGYPLGEPAEYRRTLRQFDTIVGLKRLRILHQNDSLGEFGSHRDRHAHIGEGEIGLEGFRLLVNDRRLRRVPMILETHKSEDLHEDVANLKVLRSLVRGV